MNSSYSFLERALAIVLFICPVNVAIAEDELDQAITEIAQSIASSTTDSGTRTIAVADFVTLDGTVTALGQHVAEALISELFLVGQGKFYVVERRRLADLLREQKLTMARIFDPDSRAAVEKFLGVSELATGTITDVGDQIEIHARLISVQTGMITASHRQRVRKQGTVAALLEMHPGRGFVKSTNPQAKREKKPAQSFHAPWQKTVAAGVQVEVIKATRVGTKVIIQLSIMSTKRDLDFGLFGSYGKNSSVLMTNNNMSYKATKSKLKGFEGRKVTRRISTGVAVQGELEFSGVESDAISIAQLVLKGTSKNAGADSRKAAQWSCQFKAIPIDK